MALATLCAPLMPISAMGTRSPPGPTTQPPSMRTSLCGPPQVCTFADPPRANASTTGSSAGTTAGSVRCCARKMRALAAPYAAMEP